MPPLIAFAGVLGGLAVVRWAYKTAVRINRELEEARLARVAEAAHTGRYSDAAARPRDRRVSAGLVIASSRGRSEAGPNPGLAQCAARDAHGNAAIALIPLAPADTVPRA